MSGKAWWWIEWIEVYMTELYDFVETEHNYNM